MTRARLLWIGVAVAVAAGVGVALTILAARDSSGDDSAARRLQAEATLDPRIVVFGDTVRARVDVTFDRRRVDADSLRVRAAFKEWRRVGPAEVVRADAGNTSHVRITYVLRCLKSNCPPERDVRPFEFDPVKVAFLKLGSGKPTPASVEVPWPRLLVNTRIGQTDLSESASPWRGELATVPEPSYRASPGLLIALLGVGALLLVVAGAVLAYLGWPRRKPKPVVVPAPEPEFLLTPLEQALELLENAALANGAADQRRSLELVAEVLAERGDEDGLAPAARELAWSPTAPHVAATKGLATRVRAKLDEELRELEAARRRKEAEAAAVAAAKEAHAGRA